MRFISFIKKGLDYVRKEKMIPIYIPCTENRLLNGCIAFISGGSGGIGQAITETFVKSGCKVIISGTNEIILQKICSKYEKGLVSYVVLDLNDVVLFEKKLLNILEINDINILVNCAGLNNEADFFNVTEKIYDSVMDVNVKGTFFLSQIIAKHMIERKISGHILNISSSSSLRPASQPYAISKWAINGFTKGLADILIPYGITVNAIAPGPTATKMQGKRGGDEIGHDICPCGRYTTAQEIANLALFMVSRMGDMIIGDTFYITGGSGTTSLHK